MRRRTFLAGASGLAAGCSTSSTVDIPTSTPTSSGQPVTIQTISYSVTSEPSFTEYDIVLKASVEAETNGHGLQLQLTAPNGNTRGQATIDGNDLIDGEETVTIPMTSSSSGGEFTVHIFTWNLPSDSKLIREDTLSFDGPSVSVPQASVEIQEASFSDEYGINEASVTVENDGDLPALLDEIRVDGGGGEPGTIVRGNPEFRLAPGTSRTYVETFLPNPETSEPPTEVAITVVARDGVTLASKTITAG